MKVLHIIPSYYPAFKYGGPIESVHLLNKALVSSGISVDVITTNAGLEHEDVELNKWINLEGVRIKYLPYYFYEHYNFSPQLINAVFNEIENYDLVHITAVWNFPVLAASLASLIKHKLYIISPRGALYKEGIKIKSKQIKQIYFQLIAQHYLKKAAALHFTTQDEQEKATMGLNHSKKSFVVPNGLDLSRFNKLPDNGLFKDKYPILKSKKYLLFLGRINKQKGLALLLEAFKNLEKEFDDLFLVIAGPDNNGYRKTLENGLQGCDLSQKVLFPGMLTGRDKLAAYVDAEMFILPSSFENFGMSVVEAMACGKPVVISNEVGISSEVKLNDAGMVIGLNQDSLTSGIKELLDKQELCRKFSINGRQLVQSKYDVNAVAAMMIDEYEKVLKSDK